MQPHIKESVHRLTNLLQVVLSHIEVENYKKALAAVREASKELRVLARMLIGMASGGDHISLFVPKDATIVIPSTAQVIASDEAARHVKTIAPEEIAKAVKIITSEEPTTVLKIIPPENTKEEIKIMTPEGVEVKILPEKKGE